MTTRQPAPPTSPPMWTAAHPPFAYSDARHRRYRRCRVAYYLQTYGSWRGWEAAPDDPAWLAYRCKKATPLAALVGTVVHDAMASCVRALVARKVLPTFDRLRADAATTLNTAWSSSKHNRRTFLRRPSQVAAPMLLEWLYGDVPSAHSLQQSRQKLDHALQRLLSCDALWDEVRCATPTDVRLVDPFFSFVLPSGTDQPALQVYAAPDLLVRPAADAPWVITDLKSAGTDDGVIDQILGYAVAARDGLHLPVGSGYVGQVIALGAAASEQVARFAITPDEIDDAARAMWANAGVLAGLVADPAINAPVAFATIARSADVPACRSCAFRAVCWPSRYAIGASP